MNFNLAKLRTSSVCRFLNGIAFSLTLKKRKECWHDRVVALIHINQPRQANILIILIPCVRGRATFFLDIELNGCLFILFCRQLRFLSIAALLRIILPHFNGFLSFLRSRILLRSICYRGDWQ